MHVQIILPTKNPREPTALFETLLCAASASIFLPHKFKMFSLFEIEFLFLQFSDTSVLCWVPLFFSVAWRLPPGGNHWAYLFPSLLSGITMLAPIIQCLKNYFRRYFIHISSCVEVEEVRVSEWHVWGYWVKAPGTLTQSPESASLSPI